MIQAQFDSSFEGWRNEARRLVQEGIDPSEICWGEQSQPLLTFDSSREDAAQRTPLRTAGISLRVPAAFLDLARIVACARDDGRWSLLYRLLYRLQFESPDLLKVSVDSDVHRAERLAKSVRHDIHKMHAFVRFKKASLDGVEHYVAWHKPEHLILKEAAPFFERRFGDRLWTIFTPDGSAHWNLQTLSYGPGLSQKEFDARDDWDEVWKTYYKSIFNPARIKIKAMRQEMATKYWSALPEASLIHELVREAPNRLQKMADQQFTSARPIRNGNLQTLREQALVCQSCPLHSNATQTVFGVGPENARLMIVGEQPGDREDEAGVPFIGPAGDVLMGALAECGVPRSEVYLTNAVKHFKWIASAGVRLHKKASGREMHACKPWLEAEISIIRPKVILALGSTAGTAVLGRLPKISDGRGRQLEISSSSSIVVLSWHPSAILRAKPDEAAKMRCELMNDIELAVRLAEEAPAPEGG